MHPYTVLLIRSSKGLTIIIKSWIVTFKTEFLRRCDFDNANVFLDGHMTKKGLEIRATQTALRKFFNGIEPFDGLGDKPRANYILLNFINA